MNYTTERRLIMIVMISADVLNILINHGHPRFRRQGESAFKKRR